MPELTITGKIKRRTVGRRPKAPPTPQDPAETKPAPKPSGPSRLARMLALAYRVERAIESGELEDHAHAARVLGVSRARTSQIEALMLLPIETQEDVLLGRTTVTERSLRTRRLHVDATAMPA